MIAAADDCIYLRPTGFVDAPFGHDGKVAQLAGGLLWFGAVEIILRTPGAARHASILAAVAECDAIRSQLPAPLQRRFYAQWQALTSPRAPLALGNRTLRFDQPHIMGILNVTPDSFSDGGRFDSAADVAAAAVDMAAAGASIIDLGGESTRPGAEDVWEGDEIARVAPVLDAIYTDELLLSIDTRKAAVAEAALGKGARIVNDVSGLTHDPRMGEVVAHAQCPLVLMHMAGTPQTMQAAPRYADCPLDVFDWLEAAIAGADARGIARTRIIADPGIGFGKSLAHNLALINQLSLFHALGVPVLLGASRKRLIGALSNEARVEQRLGGSIALVMAGLAQGAQLLRVHDVPESVQAMRVWRGLRDAALMPGR